MAVLPTAAPIEERKLRREIGLTAGFMAGRYHERFSRVTEVLGTGLPVNESSFAENEEGTHQLRNDERFFSGFPEFLLGIVNETGARTACSRSCSLYGITLPSYSFEAP